MAKYRYMNEIDAGLRTAFIDMRYSSNLAYKPEFLSNVVEKNRDVLSVIERELQQCDEFAISVAFITKGGITPLLQVLKELSDKGIRGRLLTTDYLTFTDPDALKMLSKNGNIEIRMFRTNLLHDAQEGFHTKGYIFRQEEVYKIIIGSSNMTQAALAKNHEWNMKFVGTQGGEAIHEILAEFEDLWNGKATQKYQEFIDDYRLEYLEEKVIREQKEISRAKHLVSFEAYRLQPNTMQISFIEALRNLRIKGEKRALLVSATGTGKTYASAFAMREEKQEKVLFLVHREQIAKQALASYEKVMPDTFRMKLLSGNSHLESVSDIDYLFSTMSMMAKFEIHSRFSKDFFDTIIIDEAHRSGSNSYQTIMNYFQPKMWLGMTASPERTDGFDVFDAFDHNIACEIRLQQALEEDLLCPFHYFGITDLSVDGIEIGDLNNADKDSVHKLKLFNLLTSDQRANYILKQADYYGYSGDRVKGLMFCSRLEEAQELSRKFNERGKRTLVLSGDTLQEEREHAIERLVTDDLSGDYLDYILSVDIFNEGVDVPELNQIIMLRPTKSPIVFVQQLGRGLRKAKGKEYVVILDFIGNYQNNFMIPVALSGDRSYNKDSMRRFVNEGSRMIPGCSTIHFDEIARHRIYQSIDNAKTNDIKMLRDAYINLKIKLGRIPKLTEFYDHGTIDAAKYFDKFGSYYNFLVKYESEYTVRLSEVQENMIQFLSQKLAKGKRVIELVILKDLIDKQIRRLMHYYRVLSENYSIQMSQREEESAVRYLSNEFGKIEEQKKFNHSIFVEEKNDEITLSTLFREQMKNQDFSAMVKEIIDFGIEQYQRNYSKRYAGTAFQLYQKYTYEDVCRLLNWKKNLNAQNLGGYFYDSETKTLPVFINYQKAEDAIAYEDRFLNKENLIALSKHPRKVTSPDADHFYKRTEQDKDNRIYLFVRKNKDDNEAKEFYFLGEIFAEGEPTPVVMEKSKDSAFEIHYRLDTPVREDIYDYITEESL